MRVSSGDALHSGQQEGKGGGGGEGDQGHDGCGQHEHVQLIAVTQVYNKSAVRRCHEPSLTQLHWASLTTF